MINYEVQVYPIFNSFHALIAYGVSLIYRGYTEREWDYDAIFSRTLGEYRARSKAKHLARKYGCKFYSFENAIIEL